MTLRKVCGCAGLQDEGALVSLLGMIYSRLVHSDNALRRMLGSSEVRGKASLDTVYEMGKNDFCVAYGCNHHRAYGATCTFFTFPEDPEYFQRWTNACKRDVVYESGKRTKWTPSEYQKLCSCHFESDRCPDPKSRKPGNKNKIPTIFSHKEKPKRRRPNKLMIRSHDKLQEPSPTVSSFSESTASVDTVSETTNQHESLQESLRVVEAPERNGHDYLQTLSDRKSFQNFEDLSSSDPDFTKFFNSVQKDSKIYQEMCSKNQIFKMEVIQQNKQLFNFYTGLDLDVFNSLFTYLQRKASSMQYMYFHGERTTYVQPFNLDGYGVKRKPGVTRQLSLQEEFFSVLYRLQTGHLLEECSLRFGVSSSQFSRNFTTWINLLSMELELLCKNAEPDEDVGLASCFKPFPNLRVILDCTELFSETPSSVEYHKQTHSNYKHHSTIKFLVGIHPSGAVTYISKAYPGKSSDKQITQESLDLIDSLIPGQKVMVDRGFTIEEDLPCGVKLVIPSFKGASRQQLTANELSKSKVISRARVHVERCMRRIKSFNILRQELKLSQVDVYEQIFKTCAYLVNFQNPYLKSDDYGVSELKHNADT